MSRKKEMVLNMTSGNPMSLLIKFSIPMLLGNLFQQVYNLADSIIVGKLVGSDALAAIGATNSVTFLFFALCNGIGAGGGIVTSQSFGRGDSKEVKKCITNTGYIMILFPLIVGIAAFFLARPILLILNTPDNIIGDSLTYMRIMAIGVVFVSMYNYISSMLRALGDSKTPLYFLIFSCILNVFLDIFFVYSLGMGVMGAGVATVIAQFLSGIGCAIFAWRKNEYFKLTKDDMKFDGYITNSVIKLGVPLSLQFSLISISCMALQRVVNSFGPVVIAAFTATSRVEQLIHQPYTTLGTALSTYTGQNFGARKKNRIIAGYRKSLLLMVIFSAVMLPVMYIFGDDIMRFFVDEEEVIATGAKALQITSLFYAFLGVIYVVRGVLNGMGDAFFALLNGIVEVIGRFTAPIILVSIPILGVWGIWWSVGIVWFISGFTAWLRYIYYKKKVLNYTDSSGEEAVG